MPEVEKGDMNDNGKVRKRGGCLTAFLIFMIAANGLSALLYLLGGSVLGAQLPDYTPWVITALGVLGLANAISAIGVWMWKRWGFYGYLAVTVLSFALNVYIGQNIVSSLMGFIGVITLYLLMRPVWNQME